VGTPPGRFSRTPETERQRGIDTVGVATHVVETVLGRALLKVFRSSVPREPMRTLREVNRRLLDAIEEPPDTGEEQRLDRLAAALWDRTRSGEGLDPGSLCRVRHKLRVIADASHEGRARHLERARELLADYAVERDE
jgi:hypothetical protein